jgi:hypothetical protein
MMDGPRPAASSGGIQVEIEKALPSRFATTDGAKRLVRGSMTPASEPVSSA